MIYLTDIKLIPVIITMFKAKYSSIISDVVSFLCKDNPIEILYCQIPYAKEAA